MPTIFRPETEDFINTETNETFTTHEDAAENVSASLGNQPITSSALEDTGDVPFEDVEDLPPSTIGDLEEPEKIDTPVRDDFDGLLGDLDEINEGLLGKSEFTAGQEDEAGISGLETTMDELGGQLRFLKGRETSIPIELQSEGVGRGRTAGGVAPLQSARLRDNAVEAFRVSSLIDGVNIQLGAARRKVDAAVEEKYGALELEKQQILENLDILVKSGVLDEEEKKQADATRERIKKEQDELAMQKETEREVLNTVAELAPQIVDMPNAAKILAEMQNAEGLIEVYQIAANYGVSLEDPQSLTGTSTDLRTFATLHPELKVGSPEFLKAFNTFQAKGGSVTPTVSTPVLDEISNATNKDLKTMVRNTFSTEFATKIISEFTDEILREFLYNFEAEQAEQQQSVEPEMFLEVFKEYLGIKDKKDKKDKDDRSSAIDRPDEDEED